MPSSIGNPSNSERKARADCGVRLLTSAELQALRLEMQLSASWMVAELARRKGLSVASTGRTHEETNNAGS